MLVRWLESYVFVRLFFTCFSPCIISIVVFVPSTMYSSFCFFLFFIPLLPCFRFFLFQSFICKKSPSKLEALKKRTCTKSKWMTHTLHHHHHHHHHHPGHPFAPWQYAIQS
ncbi:MAG: hypothetical protein J3R72DRAFT_61582 [Linnemannia gamsii]|nr:MAG: hypothetical protein J3R72DRAFT_61582 [Linnemannia gamsii]